ncbi:hypothetical protein SETIT_9G486400v2 [Setaria italica]|uniref:FBD domain-containing protein n=1 Tax=Setaria italica TaxID=4555 RepID=A0A368STU4_SETIT|nr:hypothetical protein SETIT_9G486400v2 [Setaria italica]
MDSAGDIDRISALPDDLLHAILAGVGEATAVTRTAVLSKRWRCVWIHAQHLEFEDTKVSRDALPADYCFADFVDWVFACRGDADIGSLEISLSRHDLCASPERVNGWLRRYAMRRAGLQHDEPAVVMPSHGRMASIEMHLSRRTFQLPVAAAARYEALTELVLCSASFDEAAAAAGGGRTLGDFVSSCCPRLRKLEVMSPRGLPQLVIRSETLQELTLVWAGDLHMLDVAAPSLLVLKLDCEHVISKKVARIAAPTPRLEEIAIHYLPGRRRPNLDIHDTASVRRLNNFHLHMHGPYCVDDDNLRLLKNCPGVEHIGVSLVQEMGATNSGLVDLTTEGHDHALLAKCFCDEVDTWRFHQKFFLGSLEEVTIHGFVGANEDMELLTLIFENSSSIRRLTINATTKYPDYDILKRTEDDEDDTKTAHRKLMNIPCTAGGCWHFAKAVYTWACYKTLVHGEANSVLN